MWRLDDFHIRNCMFCNQAPLSCGVIGGSSSSGGPPIIIPGAQLKFQASRERIGHLDPRSPGELSMTTEITTRTSAQRDPMIGRRVGGYRVASLLGQGGMGKVYLLVHAGSPGLRRVLKVVHDDMPRLHPEAVERFLVEARAAASLRHPNIIEICDYACFPEDGLPYLVMPFLDGADLDAYVGRVGAQRGHPGRISFEVALPLLLQVCAALRMAHARGIIHRDLKPSNCYVVTGDVGTGRSSPRLVLLDFGIAKVLDPALRQADVTQSRMVLGTPGFMAPEQARGHQVDHRADIYAFGVLAYEILTGRRPFRGATPEDLAIQQVNTTPQAPAALVPEIPSAVSELIMRCLSPVPSRRPGTVLEVAEDLIRAAPNGAEVAREAAPDLLVPLAIAGPTEPTFLRGAPVAVAVGTASVTGSRPRRRAVWIAMAGACAVGALFLGIRLGSGGDGSGELAAPGAGPASAPVTSVLDAGGIQAVAPALAPDAAAIAMTAAAVGDAGTVEPASSPPPAAPVPPRSAPEKPAATPPAQISRKGSGELEVFVQPWADLWLDGKHLGQTPFRQALPAGRYQLRLANEDSGKSETIAITVTADQTTTIRRTW
jgi:hypothetical protein